VDTGVSQVRAEGEHVALNIGAVSNTSLDRSNCEGVAHVVHPRPVFTRPWMHAQMADDLEKDPSGSGRLKPIAPIRDEHRFIVARMPCASSKVAVQLLLHGRMQWNQTTLAELRLSYGEAITYDIAEFEPGCL